MIQMENISKTFRVARRDAGMGQAVKALFHRQYTEVHALQDVSFTIQDGEMVGYIGPNGAGRSTSIKVMCGVLTPDAGRCTSNGLTPWRDRAQHVRSIGVVFGQRSQLYWDLPVSDTFDLYESLYSVPQKRFRENCEFFTELLDMKGFLHQPVRLRRKCR